jgi:pyruvate, water dikinase
MGDSTGRRIVWIDTVDPDDALARTGAKMGRLAEMARDGLSIPLAFAVTIDGFREHVAETGLDETIDRHLDGMDADDSTAVEVAAEAIRASFRETAISPALAEEIEEAYEELSDRCSDLNVPVAVRSSATGEDSSDASFAGIFDTYLGISGAQATLNAVRDCWASLFTTRAVDYRLKRGISHRDMPMAVGVVELVHARASGVAFSVHPVTGKSDRIVIEANWGWGEAVVQGLVTPDHVEVGKADGRILKHDVSRKDIVSAFDFAAGVVVEIPMPTRLRERACLDEEQISAIAAAVLEIESRYGYPVDVEWVVSRHRRPGEPVSIVQSRPVTTAVEQASPSAYDPMVLAQKYIFSAR